LIKAGDLTMNAFINLRISGVGLDLQKITRSLLLEPDGSYKKGDVVISNITGKETVHKEDSWIAGIETQGKKSVEDAVVSFLETLEPHSAYLKELSSSFDVTLWLSLYPEYEQMNVHLSHSVIAQAYEMGVSIGVSAMFLKDFYEGNC
jgi:hypothetical protein